jgi:hypothetical protein
MEPWRAVDAYNGGVEAQNGVLVTDSHHLNEEQYQNPDPH